MGTVSDLGAIKKWNEIPKDYQRKLLENVFCGKCGVTTIINYDIKTDKYGILLSGVCKQCRGKVVRLIENE